MPHTRTPFSRVGLQDSVSGFQGLERCDPMAAGHACAHVPPDIRALLHRALNGTFWTEDHLHHIAEADTPQCKWCSERDSCYHRIWLCPHFTATRAQVLARHPGAAGLVQPECLPERQSHHAWPCEPTGLRSLWRLLAKIPDECHDTCRRVVNRLCISSLTAPAFCRPYHS